MFLVACDQLPFDTDVLHDFKIPKVDDLELGDARYVWDLDGNLYGVTTSDHRVAHSDLPSG